MEKYKNLVIVLVTFSLLMPSLVEKDYGVEASSNRNIPPVANFTFLPSIPSKNENVIFNASNSYDPDGYIVNYTWQFGDGFIGYGKIVRHAYNMDSIYNVTLMVRDNNNVTANITKKIIVDEPPVANYSFNVSEKSVKFISNSYDPDGYIVNYTWQFGDGFIGYGKNVSHNYTQEAIYSTCLIVTDNYGKESKICKNVTIDLTPPSVKFVLPPINGKNGWYISKIDVKIDAIDDVSGIEEIKYRVDKGEWKNYLDSIKIEKEGWHTIEAYVKDKNGNVAENGIQIKIDYTSPVTTFYIDKNASKGWYRQNINVSLYSRDILSGVDKIYYMLDNQIYTYNSIIEVGEGNHSFIYYSTDKAGNIENLNKMRIRIDKHAPIIKIISPTEGIYIFGRKLFSASYIFIIGNISIITSAFDNLSRVSKVEFYVDGILKYTDKNAPYEWNLNEKMVGIKDIQVKAYDNAGNIAMITERVFILNL